MSFLKRCALAVVIMAAVMAMVYFVGDNSAPAVRRSPESVFDHPAASAVVPGPDYAVPTPGTPELPDPGVASPPPAPADPLPSPPRGQQGPAVVPRPPASLDGVRLTPGRWVMPMAPRAYRVGCAYACYVSDSGLPHTGQDFPVAEGTPVRSVGAGRVLRSESIYVEDGEKQYCQARPICGQDWTSYGNFVEIQDATDPSLTIWYAHLSARGVVAGQWLAAGQLIGRSGNVGNSEGPHLHFEVRRENKAMDPLPVLRSRGAVPQPGPIPAPTPAPVPAPSPTSRPSSPVAP